MAMKSSLLGKKSDNSKARRVVWLLLFSFSWIIFASYRMESSVVKTMQPLRPVTTDWKARWLHVPKTGTSFVNTLLFWVCPDLPDKVFFHGHVLLNPDEIPEACKAKLMARFEFNLDGPAASFSPENLREIHKPLDPEMSYSSLAHTFAFFRDPVSRLVSHFMFQWKWKEDFIAKFQSLSLEDAAASICNYKENHQLSNPYFRMVMGKGRLKDPNPSINPEEVYRAIERIKNLGFVGVTSEWNASICLFHKQWMSQEPVRDSELIDINHNPNMDDIQAIRSFVKCPDFVDEIIWAAVQERFRHDIQKYPDCGQLLSNEFGL